MDLQVSPRFASRFELREELGRGSFGFVHAARDRASDRELAIKFYQSGIFDSWEHRQRAVREAQVLARIKHKHVVKVYGAGEEGEYVYIAFERVRGKDLREAIDLKAPFPPLEAIRIASQIAEGLAALHQQQVIHRDLKPANVMLDEDNDVRIIDLGLAKSTARIDGTTSQAGMIRGTPIYMSPEQAQGKDVTLHADLYGLGCILYEMLCAQPPFADSHPFRILQMHVTEQPDTLRERGISVPPVLEDLVMNLLEKDPRKRPRSATLLLSQLEKARRAVLETDREESAAGAAAAPDAGAEITDKGLMTRSWIHRPHPRPAPPAPAPPDRLPPRLAWRYAAYVWAAVAVLALVVVLLLALR